MTGKDIKGIGTLIQAHGDTLDGLIPYNFNTDALGFIQGSPNSAGGLLAWDNTPQLILPTGAAILGSGVSIGEGATSGAFGYLDTSDGTCAMTALFGQNVTCGTAFNSDSGQFYSDGAGNIYSTSLSVGAGAFTLDSDGSGALNGGVFQWDSSGHMGMATLTSDTGGTIYSNGLGTLTALHFVGEGSGLTGVPAATSASTFTDFWALGQGYQVSGTLTAAASFLVTDGDGSNLSGIVPAHDDSTTPADAATVVGWVSAIVGGVKSWLPYYR